MTIKIKISKFENAFSMQILEMDERFRCVDKKISFEPGPELIRILSEDHPEFNHDCFWLRGKDTSKDLTIMTYRSKNNRERDSMIHRIELSLMKWASEWEGFTPLKKETSSKDDFIFEV